MLNRILIILWAICFSFPLMAQSVLRQDGLIYRLYLPENEKPYAEVSGNLFTENTNLYIPDTINYDGVDYSVKIIGDAAFKGCEFLTSISLPGSISRIGSEAFRTCPFTSLIIPSSVRNVGSDAFLGSDLEEVIIQSSDISIENGAFDWCSIYKVAYPVNLPDPFDEFVPTKITFNPEGTALVDNFIYSSDRNAIIYAPIKLDGEFSIPSSVKSIENQAFAGCDELSSIIMPNSVTNIGDRAFWGCYNLKDINISEKVSYIGQEAFKGCPIQTLIIPDSVTFIGNSAFRDSGLISVELSNSLKAIGEDVFNTCIFLTTVSIPNSIESIGDNAFFYCNSLTSVTLPSSVKTIGKNAFRHCDSLSSIIIPDATEFIGSYALAETKISTLSIPISLSIISEGLCEGCRSLKSINIPNSIKAIGDSAFSLSGLSSVEIPNSVESIGRDAFAHSPLSSIALPESITTIGSTAFFCCNELNSIVLPNSIISIGEYAFGYCVDLISIFLPSSIQIIEDNAFVGCSNLSIINYNTTEPVSASKNIFDDEIYKTAILNVAIGGLEKTFSTEPWIYFVNIKEKEFASLTEIFTELDLNLPIEIYTLNGILVNSKLDYLSSGVYIIRQGNLVKKISVRK